MDVIDLFRMLAHYNRPQMSGFSPGPLQPGRKDGHQYRPQVAGTFRSTAHPRRSPSAAETIHEREGVHNDFEYAYG